jgi:hypothetical protein
VGASGKAAGNAAAARNWRRENILNIPWSFEWRGLAGNIQIIQISINQIAPSADRWLILLNKLPASFSITENAHRYLSD